MLGRRQTPDQGGVPAPDARQAILGGWGWQLIGSGLGIVRGDSGPVPAGYWYRCTSLPLCW